MGSNAMDSALKAPELRTLAAEGILKETASTPASRDSDKTKASVPSAATNGFRTERNSATPCYDPLQYHTLCSTLIAWHFPALKTLNLL